MLVVFLEPVEVYKFTRLDNFAFILNGAEGQEPCKRVIFDPSYEGLEFFDIREPETRPNCWRYIVVDGVLYLCQQIHAIWHTGLWDGALVLHID
jgi:hypothetical protein